MPTLSDRKPTAASQAARIAALEKALAEANAMVLHLEAETVLWARAAGAL